MIETELVNALKKGDEKAFTTLVKDYQHLVYNTALGMIQSVEDAEDIAQEVFMQAFDSIKSFRGEAKISTWLYRITITKCLDRIKHNNRKKRFAFIVNLFTHDNTPQNEPPDFFHPGVQMDNKELSAVLFKAINQLPMNQKIAFTLNKVEGLSYQQIADVMETTLASVEAYMHRAKQNLRKLLNEFYNN